MLLIRISVIFRLYLAVYRLLEVKSAIQFTFFVPHFSVGLNLALVLMLFSCYQLLQLQLFIHFLQLQLILIQFFLYIIICHALNLPPLFSHLTARTSNRTIISSRSIIVARQKEFISIVIITSSWFRDPPLTLT